MRTEEIRLRGLDAEHQYSLLYSISALDSLEPDARVTIEIVQGAVILGAKTLHARDEDFYTQFRISQAGNGPNHDWQHAMSIPLGKTVFASGDDAEYIPLPGTPRHVVAEDPNGEDWYQFAFRETTPKLISFQIELMDRDQLPVDVRVYRLSGGKPVPVGRAGGSPYQTGGVQDRAYARRGGGSTLAQATSRHCRRGAIQGELCSEGPAK